MTKRKKMILSVSCGIFLFACCILYLVSYASSAKEITILYTGDTHSMLYPCSCPMERDGGIARRATLLKDLKRKYPDALILDSGNFFAGGVKDEYTQNTEMDKARTAINLKAMELMKYDAAAISAEEFNFGSDYLNETLAGSSLKFLSCNFKSDKVFPFLMREVSGIKVGIIGLTPPAANKKAGGEQIIDPKIAVSAALGEAKKQGANIIVLLSQLSDAANRDLAAATPGIDVIITGYPGEGGRPVARAGNTLILSASWQGRKLGKSVLSLKDNKIVGEKSEDIRLSDKISDDKRILDILPRCFSDGDCKKEGLIGLCQNPATNAASCMFSEAHKVDVTVITSKDCVTCDTKVIIKALKAQIPGLNPAEMDYTDKAAAKLIEDFKMKGLPAYIFSREIEKEKAFSNMKEKLELKGDYYMLKPQASGMSLFLDRAKAKGTLDVFFSLFDPASAQLLATLKEFKPRLHLLAIFKDGSFDAPNGNTEIEEDLRSVCVQKYNPDKFWDYISCRAKNINSSWWEDCAQSIDTDKIRACARGEEGKALLKENIALNKELEVMLGPTYLMDNREIFSSRGAPSKDELEKILKR
jgi:hypothetical protein